MLESNGMARSLDRRIEQSCRCGPTGVVLLSAGEYAVGVFSAIEEAQRCAEVARGPQVGLAGAHVVALGGGLFG